MNRPATVAALLLALTPFARASVDESLDVLHQSGQSLQSFAADVSMGESSGLGDKSTRTGNVVLQRRPGGDSRARISFDKKVSGTKIFAEKHDYLLDGTDLIDRDYSIKKQVTRQVRRPGEKVDFFKLGEGPFPLPIGQPRADVLANFDVTEEKNDDPAVLAVLTLKPKDKTPMAESFRWIRVAIDRQTKLPRVVTTLARNGQDRVKVTFSNVRVDDAVKDADFALVPITAGEWQLVGTK